MCARKINGASGQAPANGASTRYASLSRQSPDGRASFAGTPDQLLAAAMDAATSAGDLVGFSRTSDGGAICVFVKAEGLDFKAYASTQVDLDAALQIIVDAN